VSGCGAVNPGPSPVRRLSRAEYEATVADLFGGQVHAPVMFNPEARVDFFDNNSQNRVVTNVLAQQYFESAEQVATAAVAKLPALLPCDPAAMGEAACLDRFLDSFGKRAWRRPLLPAERDNLKQAFMQGRTNSFAEGIQELIQVMLLAPQFMYRLEAGVPVAGSDYLRLNPYELASRLSYLIWGSMPDDQLFAAADAGKLGTAADVKAQAQRMLDDPRAARMVGHFTDQWLRLEEIATTEKQPRIYPAWKDGALKDAMHAEAQAFLDDVLWKGDAKIETLLTAPYTFVNGPLAAYYGIKGVTGDAFQKVPVDPQQRAGFLTQAGLLSVLGVPDEGLTSLIYRGLFVRERLLCQPIADPPPDAQSMNPPVTEATTARQSSLDRQKISLCGACHGQMDNIGMGFESFDAIGLYRTTDKGVPVDAHGALTSTDIDGAFDGAVELGKKMAGSKQVHECLATQWFRYGYGREETPQDSCAMDALKKVSVSSGGSFKELLLALTQTDAFLLRSKGDQP